jgi:hypothetical protein
VAAGLVDNGAAAFVSPFEMRRAAASTSSVAPFSGIKWLWSAEGGLRC